MNIGMTCSQIRMKTATNSSSIPIDCSEPVRPVSMAMAIVASEKMMPRISRAGTNSRMGSSK